MGTYPGRKDLMRNTESAAAAPNLTRDGSRPRGAAAVLAVITCLTMSLPVPLDAQSRIPVRTRDLELRGVIHQQSMRASAELRAYVATPFGRIPVTGHARLTYTCTGSFHGSVDYNVLIRLLARLKDIDLVTHVQGQLIHDRPPRCGSGPDVVVFGQAVTDSLDLSGWARVASDSFTFQGTTWYDGRDHHGEVASVGRENGLRVSYTMFAHGRSVRNAERSTSRRPGKLYAWREWRRLFV